MAASAEIAGRDVGLSAENRKRIVTACVREYRDGMRGFASESHLDVWYDRLTASELVERFGGQLGAKGRIQFAKPFAKARRKTSLRAVEKLTERVDGELRFRSVPPLLVPFRELFEPGEARSETSYIRDLLRNYAASLDPDRQLPLQHLPLRRHGPQGRGRRQRRHARVDIPPRRPRRPGPARASGEGGAGVGARALSGRQRVREPWRAGRPRTADLERGQRHLPQLAAERGHRRQGARLLRAPALGLEGVDRPLDDERHRVCIAYTRACGWSLARAHARSGDRLAIAAYLGAARSSTRRSPASRARTPTRTSCDYQRLAEAVEAGDVPAEFGF